MSGWHIVPTCKDISFTDGPGVIQLRDDEEKFVALWLLCCIRCENGVPTLIFLVVNHLSFDTLQRVNPERVTSFVSRVIYRQSKNRSRKIYMTVLSKFSLNSRDLSVEIGAMKVSAYYMKFQWARSFPCHLHAYTSVH